MTTKLATSLSEGEGQLNYIMIDFVVSFFKVEYYVEIPFKHCVEEKESNRKQGLRMFLKNRNLTLSQNILT